MFKIFCRIYQFAFKYAAYCLPWRKPELLEGEGCVIKLPELILKKGIKSVLLVTDSVIMSLGLPDGLLASLKEAGIDTFVYDKTVPNPTLDNIEEAYTIYKENNCKVLSPSAAAHLWTVQKVLVSERQDHVQISGG